MDNLFAINNVEIGELARRIQFMNPKAKVWATTLADEPYPRIYSTVAPESLVLPEPFYYNEKNGITNKHRTKTGMYVAYEVVLVK